MASAMTFDTLLSDIALYAERSDSDFLNQRARFVNQAESRIASEARGLGFMRSVTDDLRAGRSYAVKPARWRETVSLQIGTGTNYRTRVNLLPRSYEFCREYWTDPTKTSTPRYYADWDYNHWLIVPTPAFNFPYETIYHERPKPLSSSNQTSWTTQYAPQLLLYASLLEVQPFLKRDDRVKVFNDEYNRALQQLSFEQARRMMDRTTKREQDAG